MRPAAWVMHDILNNVFEVALPLCEGHGVRMHGAPVVFHVRVEHRAGALPLPSDHAARSRSPLPGAAGRGEVLLIFIS